MSASTLERGEAEFTNRRLFDEWAPVYDEQSNPLLMLEERFLKRLLPSCRDKDILDVGCGTGRWLYPLSYANPRSLTGVDVSEQMLSVARRKEIADSTLHLGVLPTLPLMASSSDLAICCFTLSYAKDLQACAKEFARVLRPDGELFITDMHPGTALELGWRRGSRHAGALQCSWHPIESIVEAMGSHGLQLCGRYEPSFGSPELPAFRDNGKLVDYQKAADKPAIFLLHFQKRSDAVKSDMRFEGAKVVLGATESLPLNFEAAAGQICNVTSAPLETGIGLTTHLHGYTCFPGLINPHDHLEFALFRRLGHPPYGNASEWAHDIQREFLDEIARHKEVPMATRLWWGALRNLLCGVTTVCHHNPLHEVFQRADFLVRVHKDFAWGHSLEFQPDLVARYSQAQPSQPFIVHASEGVDSKARAEFSHLDRLGLLQENTVLVHGLAMNDDEIDTLNQRRASVIRCPSSNDFLFGRTSTFRQDKSIRRITIGSDSPLTAIGDLLDELAFCHDTLDYPEEALFQYCYDGAPEVLRLNPGAGRLNANCPADFFAVRSRDCSPAQHLSVLTWRDVELVVVDGTVRLVSSDLLPRLHEALRVDLEPLQIDGVTRWLKAPVISLFRQAADVLGNAAVSLNGRPLSLSEA